jgi:hypothetical protein
MNDQLDDGTGAILNPPLPVPRLENPCQRSSRSMPGTSQAGAQRRPLSDLLSGWQADTLAMLERLQAQEQAEAEEEDRLYETLLEAERERLEAEERQESPARTLHPAIASAREGLYLLPPEPTRKQVKAALERQMSLRRS